MSSPIAFRLWLPIKVRPLARAVGFIGLLFGIITLTVATRESVARWDRATRTWARSAEILILKRDISTLNAVTEFLRREYPSVQIYIKDRSSSVTVLWSYPQGGFDLGSSDLGLLNRNIMLNADSGLMAEIHVNWVDVINAVLWNCVIVLFFLIVAIITAVVIFRYCIDRVVLEVDKLTQGSESEIQELSDLVRARERAEQMRAAAESEAALGHLAFQVAHDIRSPLAAMNVIESDLHFLPDDTRALLSATVSRIREISNNLLQSGVAHTKGEAFPSEPVSVYSLDSIVEPLVKEKRLEFRAQNWVEIRLLTPCDADLFVAIQPTEFTRLLSNLINNSAESLAEPSGIVSISLCRIGEFAQLDVSDDGKGIAPDLLPLLGIRGGTHGKADGNGLGLSHAKAAAERWGGSLTVDSRLGFGTSVTIMLPLSGEGQR